TPGDLDAPAREIHRVLDKVAKAVDDARIANGHRFATGDGSRAKADLYAEIAVRSDGFLDERRQRKARKRSARFRRQAVELLQDFPATIRLRPHQADVLGELGTCTGSLLHFLGDQRNGGERRAEL